MKRFVFTQLFLILMASLCQADPVFESPTLEDYLALSAEEKEAYRKNYSLLLENGFSKRIKTTINQNEFNETLVDAPSYFVTTNGIEELKRATAILLEKVPAYQKTIFIGRSATHIKFFLSGLLHGQGRKSDIKKIVELPFAAKDLDQLSDLSASQKQNIRAHLERKGLSPLQILQNKNPVLFVDFVHSGAGVYLLLNLIHDWGKEIGISKNDLAQKISFQGFFPAHFKAVKSLMNLNHRLIGEGKPIPMTEENILYQTSQTKMRLGYREFELAHEIFSFNISDDFYIHSGTHAPNTQDSFTSSNWDQGSNQNTNTFHKNSEKKAFVEACFLLSSGIIEACQSPVLKK